MNTRIFPFLLCLLLALTGCYEDESNDRLLPKATVSVTGIAESYTVGALKEVSLDITPDVVSPGNEHRAWWGIVSEKDRYNAVIDTLARTVELHIRRSFLPGEYILLYYVEDVSTGLSHMLKTRLSARTEFSKGWWVQKTTPDGTGCDIDMFPDEGSLIPDVIRNAAGQPLEGKAVDMTTAQYSFSYTTTDASGTPVREQAAPLIVASARELAVLNLETGIPVARMEDLFVEQPATPDITALCHAYGHLYLGCNGQIHAMGYSNGSLVGMFNTPLLGDTPLPYLHSGQPRTKALCFDDVRGAFFTLPEEVPEGAQLTFQVSGRAVYEDGFSQSLHFLEDAAWMPGEQYSIPYDDAYTELGLFLYADYPDGSQEEQTISLHRLAEALLNAPEPPELNPETGNEFIIGVLDSFILNADGSFTFTPGPVPVSSTGSTKPLITLIATYSDEPGTFSTESVEFPADMLGHGGGTVVGRLTGDMDTLTSVSLNVFFMTDEGENMQSIYIRGNRELIAPFTFGEPVGYTTPTAEIQTDGSITTLAYTFSDGRKARLSFTLPGWLTVDPEVLLSEDILPVLYLEDINGGSMGFVRLRPFGATDEPTLETVDTAADTVPMQIFSPAVMGEGITYADYHVTRHWATGAVATAQRNFPGSQEGESWTSFPCVLAYDWQVMPYSVELTFMDGALAASAQTEEALVDFAGSVTLSAG